jgi:hypothetical protein
MENNVMPRMLVLGFFLAFSLVAFVAGSLFAGEPDVQSKPSQKLKQRKLAPTDSLAKLFRTSDKKSSTESKLTTKKKTSKLKSARHKPRASKSLASHKHRISKTLASHKTTGSKKSVYKKSAKKSLKKPAHHRTKSAKKLVSHKHKTN